MCAKHMKAKRMNNRVVERSDTLGLTQIHSLAASGRRETGDKTETCVDIHVFQTIG